VPHSSGIGCSVAGPKAVAPVPSRRQRRIIYDAFAQINTCANGCGLTWPGLLRLAFHDAGTYSVTAGAMRGGPNGCMRFEDVHGAAPNAGLAFGLDGAPNSMIKKLLEEQKGTAREVGEIDQYAEQHPFSQADLYQFAGVVAVAELSGGQVNLTGAFRWGREDAPWLWCQGEAQDAMPDFSGGHKSGWHKHGAARVTERLQTTFETSREYFEGTLGLQPEEWVALLGAHSVGRVAGLDPGGSKAHMLPFDDTPDRFDNMYFKTLKLYGDSARISLCPQAHRPGDAHWYGPPADEASGPTALLDTDVSMTVDGDYFKHIQTYAADEQAFFRQFGKAFLATTELGHTVSGAPNTASTLHSADVNCAGSWSECTADCEVASARTWTETTAQTGDGEACPAAADCEPGDNDCSGTWVASKEGMPCLQDADCDYKQYYDTIAQNGGGVMFSKLITGF